MSAAIMRRAGLFQSATMRSVHRILKGATAYDGNGNCRGAEIFGLRPIMRHGAVATAGPFSAHKDLPAYMSGSRQKKTNFA